MVKFQITCSK